MSDFESKLNKIFNEVRFSKTKGHVDELLNNIPKKKKKHSIRVGELLHKIGAGKTGIYSGLLHDYLERGGDIESLSQHIDELGLPDNVLHIVNSLSHDDDISPLEHMKSSLKIEDDDLRNIIILIKIADRVDNLQKRLKLNKLNNKYIQKSMDLINYLISVYSGKKRLLNDLLLKFYNIILET